MKTILLTALAAAVLAVPAAAATKPNPALLHPAKAAREGTRDVQGALRDDEGRVRRAPSTAPGRRVGADRFYNLVRARFYDGDRLFRVVPGFVVQFGISSVARGVEGVAERDDPGRPGAPLEHAAGR